MKYKQILLLFILLLCINCSKEPKTLDELRQAGKEAYAGNQFLEARTYLDKALHIKASDKESLYFLGQTYQKLNQHESAVYFLKRADILHPNDREINLALYTSTIIIQDYGNAVKAINVLIATGDNPDMYAPELADYNLRDGNIIMSFYYLKKMYDEGTDAQSIYQSLGNVAVQIDSVDFAIKIMKEAIDKFGPLEKFRKDLAIYISITGDFKQAEKILTELLANNPTSQDLRYTLARTKAMYNIKEKNQESLQIYQKLRVENADYPELDSLIIDLVQKLGIDN